MTVPNTPPDPTRDDVPAVPDANPFAPPQTRDVAGLPPLPEGIGAVSKAESSPVDRLMSELRIGAATVVVCAVLGLAMAGLWAWLAPKVPLVVDGDRILYADPEGEQRAGADAVFVLVGLGMGIVTALGAFLVTRRRGGGISVAVGLAVGGLLGSLGAWRLGRSFGPSHDLIGEARRVGNGGRFYADIDLGAHGALLAWPMAAMVLLLLLSAAFGKREEDPPPYWAGPYGQPPLEGPVEQAGLDGHAGPDVKDGPAGEQGGADGRRPGLG